MPQTVSVPPELAPLFGEAEEFVHAYFDTLRREPEHGTITIGGQRYVLVRAASMSVEFFATIMHLYDDKGEQAARAVARSLLYDLAHAIGAADARAFHRALDVRDPVRKLSAGPIHFAHAGWAYVHILPESRAEADQSFRLIYDHPYSFEADAWLASDQRVDFPVCVMNAGYSAGWCTESFGLSLVAVEICCKARGDDACRFVMAPPETVGDVIETYLHEQPLAQTPAPYEIPGFFSRKRAEDELREREMQYRSIFESVTDTTLIVGLDGCIAAANPAAERLYGHTRDTLVGMHIEAITAPSARGLLDPERIAAFLGGVRTGETLALNAAGQTFEVEFHAAAFSYRRQPHILVLVNDISERKRAEAERLRLQEQLIRQNERLREELSLARAVQQGLLPQQVPWRADQCAVAVRSSPAGEVNRDFYVFVDAGHGRNIVVLGDVAGKGVAVALVTALMTSAIETQARQTTEPAAILDGLQTRLHIQLQACETSVALAIVAFDFAQRRVSVATAGMPPPVLLRQGRAHLLETSGGVSLGIVTQERWDTQQIDLLPGDRLLLASDGVIEARNPYRELFGYERLLATLDLQPAFMDHEQVIDTTFATLRAFIGDAEQHDDMTLLVVQPHGSRT